MEELVDRVRPLLVISLLVILASVGMMELETGLFRTWFYELPPMAHSILLIGPVVVIGIAWLVFMGAAIWVYLEGQRRGKW